MPDSLFYAIKSQNLSKGKFKKENNAGIIK